MDDPFDIKNSLNFQIHKFQSFQSNTEIKSLFREKRMKGKSILQKVVHFQHLRMQLHISFYNNGNECKEQKRKNKKNKREKRNAF